MGQGIGWQQWGREWGGSSGAGYGLASVGVGNGVAAVGQGMGW